MGIRTADAFSLAFGDDCSRASALWQKPLLI